MRITGVMGWGFLTTDGAGLSPVCPLTGARAALEQPGGVGVSLPLSWVEWEEFWGLFQPKPFPDLGILEENWPPAPQGWAQALTATKMGDFGAGKAVKWGILREGKQTPGGKEDRGADDAHSA